MSKPLPTHKNQKIKIIIELKKNKKSFNISLNNKWRKKDYFLFTLSFK